VRPDLLDQRPPHCPDRIHESWSSVDPTYVDQGCTGSKAADAAKAHGIASDVIKLPKFQRGFVLLPRRWAEGPSPGLPAFGAW
jgi:hypothetical protein